MVINFMWFNKLLSISSSLWDIINLRYSVKFLTKILFFYTGLEPFAVNHVAGALNSLLKKKELLTREDLQIEWKPLYQLYERLFHKNLESLGLIKLPNNIGPNVTSLIKFSRPYFSIDSTEVSCFYKESPYK